MVVVNGKGCIVGWSGLPNECLGDAFAKIIGERVNGVRRASVMLCSIAVWEMATERGTKGTLVIGR